MHIWRTLSYFPFLWQYLNDLLKKIFLSGRRAYWGCNGKSIRRRHPRLKRNLINFDWWSAIANTARGASLGHDFLEQKYVYANEYIASDNSPYFDNHCFTTRWYTESVGLYFIDNTSWTIDHHTYFRISSPCCCNYIQDHDILRGYCRDSGVS